MKDLLSHFLNPNIKKPETRDTKEVKIKPANIDSKIITFQHAELISKWIDKLEITDEIKSLYEFRLMLRGSRDGFTTKKFHEICDNQSRTVSIIKAKDSNEILGGYNPIEWNSNHNYCATKDSFIFSFKDNDRIENCILSRIKNESEAAFNNEYYGPSFGFRDLILYGNNFYKKSYCRKDNYEKSIREIDDKFSVEEYEIFQIILLIQLQQY